MESMTRKGGQGSSALDSNFTVSQADKSLARQAQLENAVDIKVRTAALPFSSLFSRQSDSTAIPASHQSDGGHKLCCICRYEAKFRKGSLLCCCLTR